MANPDRAYGYEDSENGLIGSAILLFLTVIAPLIYFGGAFFGFWQVSPNSVPAYDSAGEIVNENEYYEQEGERYLKEHEAEQAAEATWVREDLEQIRREENMEDSCRACWNKFYCNQMSSCHEAYFCMDQCGLNRLDGDSNGVPCEVICGSQ